MSTDVQMESENKFMIGEKLLCYYGTCLYDAKCLEIDSKTSDTLYFIHYLGWNKSYDEWVDEKRLIKFNDRNVQLQRQLFDECLKKSNKTPKPTKKLNNGQSTAVLNSIISAEIPFVNNDKFLNGSSTTNQIESKNMDYDIKKVRNCNFANRNSSCKPNNKKENIENKMFHLIDLSKNDVQEFKNEYLVIILPDELKDFLLDDWDQVTRQNKIVELPCKDTVTTIFNEYISTKSFNNRKLVVRIVNGFKEYFEVMLGSQLLYKFERVQYSKILNEFDDEKVSNLYGYAHLLRLFAKLQCMISYVPLDKSSFEQLVFYANDFLNYLKAHNTRYSNNIKYLLTTPEYLRSLF